MPVVIENGDHAFIYLFAGAIIISIFVVWYVVTWVKETLSNSQKYIELKPKLDNLDNSIRAHEANVESWNKQVERNTRKACFPIIRDNNGILD